MSMGRPKRRLPERDKNGPKEHHCAMNLEDTETRNGTLYLRCLCRGCGRWTETPAAVELSKKEAS